MPNKEKKESWPLVGNENITEFLSKHIKNNTVYGSYIFCGPEDLGKKTLAYHFAEVLLCQRKKTSGSEACGACPSCRKFSNRGDDDNGLRIAHSDLYVIDKEDDKKNISIVQVRELIKKLSLSSFLDSYKIGIIRNAETLSTEAANALLKTLEEPRNKVVVILITGEAEALPQTIISRSRILKFGLVKTDVIYEYLVDEYKASRSAAKNFSHLAAGRPALALKFFQDKTYYDEHIVQAETFLNFFRSDLNNRFLAIENIIGKKNKGQESVERARDILGAWRSIARDLLLIKFNQRDLINNEVMKKELESVNPGVKTLAIIRAANSIRRAEQYIRANMNPKLALEQVAVSI